MIIILLKFWRECIIALIAILFLIALATANHYSGKVKKLELQYNAELLKSQAAYHQAKADAVEKEKNWSNQLLKAEQNYNAKLKEITADAASAKSNADSLSKQLNTAKKRMSTASRETVVEYTSASSNVLESCITEYQRLAEKADGHALDVRRLSDSWPE